jgi:hypothetical protein
MSCSLPTTAPAAATEKRCGALPLSMHSASASHGRQPLPDASGAQLEDQ